MRVFALSVDVFLVGFLIVARVHGITERGEFFRNQHIPKYTTLAIFKIELGSSLHSYAIIYFYNGQVENIWKSEELVQALSGFAVVRVRIVHRIHVLNAS